MKNLMLYDSLEEATNRLAGTVVTYDGRPVLIERIEILDGILNAAFRAFPYNGNRVRAPLSDPLFNRFQSPPIGFCNFFEGELVGVRNLTNVTWCERVPSRQRRQGLASETFSASTLVDGYRVGFDNIYNQEAFREMVENDYPPFEEAFGLLVPNSSIAVARDFALRMSDGGYTFLFHKRDEIGLFVRGNLYLRSDRQHLIETISEHKNLPDRIEVM